jgi:hypothetical protein
MSRALVLCVSLLFAASGMSAQSASSDSQGFSFKGNYLGMPLSDFKAANPGKIWINTGDPNRRKNKNLTQEVATPLCTDVYGGFEGDTGPLEPGEVLCNASPGIANPDGKTVMGQIAVQVIYRFFLGKLYRIEIAMLPVNYALVSLAFRKKYGEPGDVTYGQFENGFGAVWKGEELAWKNGSQRIYTFEGSGNGPAQNSLDPANPSRFIFEDTALAPPNSSRLKIDF